MFDEACFMRSWDLGNRSIHASIALVRTLFSNETNLASYLLSSFSLN